MAGGSRSTEGLRARMARGRPNWWVILAVTLALMALLVAIAGGTPRPKPGNQALTATSGPAGHRSHPEAQDAPNRAAPPATSTTLPGVASANGPVSAAGSSASALTTNHLTHSSTPAASAPPTTTTSAPAPVSAPAIVPTTTTTTAPSVAQPATRSQWQGYLEPPVQTATGFGFTGTGAMSVSVVWSGSTYLTMSVSCANGTQNVGGTSAMAASVPDAIGNCRATVSEPTSESTALTFTVSIGPAGG